MTNKPLPSMRFDHAGMSVADLNVSRAFYADVLGFSTLEETFELKGHNVSGAILLNAQGVRIELFERKDSKPVRVGHPIEDTSLQGWFQFALSVDDVDAVFEQVVAAGAKPVLSPRVAPDGRAKFAFIGDPDNNLVEFIQRNAV